MNSNMIDKTIYVLCFGNPYLNNDSLAPAIADYFHKNPVKGIEFVKCIAPDELLNYTDKNFFILDVVKDLKEIRFFKNLDMLQANNLVSLHDFDLGFFLKLMKETEQITEAKIIGIPMDGKIIEVKDIILRTIEENK